MTELPPEMGANFGLTNRTFRKNAAPTGDRSGWTDTPADRERKQKVCALNVVNAMVLGECRGLVVEHRTPNR